MSALDWVIEVIQSDNYRLHLFRVEKAKEARKELDQLLKENKDLKDKCIQQERIIND